MIKLLAQQRPDDPHGSGAYGASRGNRKHNGVDYAALPNSQALSSTRGKVTKIGYPYDPNDPKKGTFRYVEVTTDGYRIRYFYVYPLVMLGENVEIGEVIGSVQDLRSVYRKITPHIHLEVKDEYGEFVDPREYFKYYGVHDG
jgi:murein DD-endopeptidase MepM/ murein hydrolase activator NlpD